MPDKLYDYADYIKLRLVINLYCSRQRTIMYSVEVHNGLYDTKRGRRKMGRDTFLHHTQETVKELTELSEIFEMN